MLCIHLAVMLWWQKILIHATCIIWVVFQPSAIRDTFCIQEVWTVHSPLLGRGPAECICNLQLQPSHSDPTSLGQGDCRVHLQSGIAAEPPTNAAGHPAIAAGHPAGEVVTIGAWLAAWTQLLPLAACRPAAGAKYNENRVKYTVLRHYGKM